MLTAPVLRSRTSSAQPIRSNLVSQYNNILDQITSTAQDASFNGVNLLNGDQLKLTFNETGKSTLTIQGVNFNFSGLGLAKLTAGTDFLDNSSANKAIASLEHGFRARCVPRPRPSVRTSRSCRSVRTSRRT